MLLAIWLVMAPGIVFDGADFTWSKVRVKTQAFRELQCSTLDSCGKLIHEGFEGKILIQVAIVQPIIMIALLSHFYSTV